MKQEKRIAFRCDEDTFYQVKDQADDAGLNVSDYIKWLIENDAKPINERG